ncbi:hypothetical protein ABZP36_010942 [Zizania latifolia]
MASSSRRFFSLGDPGPSSLAVGLTSPIWAKREAHPTSPTPRHCLAGAVGPFGGGQDSEKDDFKGAGAVEKVYIPEYDGEHLDDSDDDKLNETMVMAPSLPRIEEAKEDADSDSVTVWKSQLALLKGKQVYAEDPNMAIVLLNYHTSQSA